MVSTAMNQPKTAESTTKNPKRILKSAAMSLMRSGMGMKSVQK